MMHDLEKVRSQKPEKSLMAMDASMPMGPMLPYLSLSTKDLPEMKDWEVGKKYKIEVEVRMTSYSENRSLRYKETTAGGSFEITKVGVDSDSDETDE